MLLWTTDQNSLLSLSKCINNLHGELPPEPSWVTCALNQPAEIPAWAGRKCHLQPVTVQLSPQSGSAITGVELEEGEEEKDFRGCREIRALIRCDWSNKESVLPREKASLVFT